MHIYPLSRLVNAHPVCWEDLLKSIEEGKEFAFSWYQPLREAVVSYCQARGSNRNLVVKRMRAQALATWRSNGPKVAKANEDAFDVFESSFYPRIKSFQREFLRDRQTEVPFEGLLITGAPHFKAIDENDEEQFVLLLPAKWTRNDVRAYLELLSVIIEARFPKSSKSIWCMDLRSGKDVNWRGPNKRMRTKCAKAARLFKRLGQAPRTP